MDRLTADCRRVAVSLLLAIASLLWLAPRARSEVLPPLRIPNPAIGTRCFGLLPCTNIDPFGLRLRESVFALFRPEKGHDRDFYAARIHIAPSITLMQWAEIGVALPITLYKKHIGVAPVYEPLQPFARLRIPLEKILGGVATTAFVRVHIASGPFVGGLPPLPELMAQAAGTYQQQTQFEVGLALQKRIGPVSATGSVGTSVAKGRVEVYGGGELAYHFKIFHAFLQGQGIAIPKCPPDEAALNFCARAFRFAAGVRFDWDIGQGGLLIGTGSSAVEPGWLVGAQLGIDYDETTRRRHGDGVEAAHKWWERRFEAMARGWAAWRSAAAVWEPEAQPTRPVRIPTRGRFSDVAGPAGLPSLSPWLEALLGEDSLPEHPLFPSTPGASPAVAGKQPPMAIPPRPVRGRSASSRDLYHHAMARAQQQLQLGRAPRIALPGSLEVMTDEELARIEWQLAQEELRRAERQRRQESPDLPPVSKAIINGLARVPYNLLSPFFMGSPERAAEIAALWERLRPAKYTPEEQELGETMEEIAGMAAEIAATMGGGALLEAEATGARVAMRAVAKEAAKRAGRRAAYEAAESSALGTAETVGVEAAELGGAESSRFLGGLRDRLNPFNYEIRGLGSNFGNVKYGGRVPLYRAVDSAELADIERTGAFRSNPRQPPSAKYFSTNAEGASSYARQAQQGFGEGPYTIVKTTAPRMLVTPEAQATVDRGVSAVVIRPENLHRLAPAKILKQAPIPKR